MRSRIYARKGQEPRIRPDQVYVPWHLLSITHLLAGLLTSKHPEIRKCTETQMLDRGPRRRSFPKATRDLFFFLLASNLQSTKISRPRDTGSKAREALCSLSHPGVASPRLGSFGLLRRAGRTKIMLQIYCKIPIKHIQLSVRKGPGNTVSSDPGADRSCNASVNVLMQREKAKKMATCICICITKCR